MFEPRIKNATLFYELKASAPYREFENHDVSAAKFMRLPPTAKPVIIDNKKRC